MYIVKTQSLRQSINKHKIERKDVAMANARTYVDVEGYRASAKVFKMMVEDKVDDNGGWPTFSEKLIGEYVYRDGQVVFKTADEIEQEKELEDLRHEVFGGPSEVECAECGALHIVEADNAFECTNDGCSGWIQSHSKRIGLL